MSARSRAIEAESERASSAASGAVSASGGGAPRVLGPASGLPRAVGTPRPRHRQDLPHRGQHSYTGGTTG